MRIAVIGQGSIGKRHTQNLMSLGHRVVPIDLGNGMDYDVSCAFICSPTELHLEQAQDYIDREIPVFIEKPLTYSLSNLIKFAAKNEGTNVPTMVGCNLRFHPAIRDAKDLIAKHKVIFARAEFGYYLPFWRKGDYTKTYSAGVSGGIIIDDIHEYDYLYHLFGDIDQLKIVYGKVTDLDIKCEDIAEAVIMFKNGVSASIHQDYICKNYHRELTLNFGHETVKFKIHPTNLMYKKEVEYFIRCIDKNIKPMNDIVEAASVLRRVLEAKSCCNHSGKAYVN